MQELPVNYLKAEFSSKLQPASIAIITVYQFLITERDLLDHV